MTKDDAHTEALKRWRQLPAAERQTTLQAEVYGRILAESLSFHTMGDPMRIITAWLISDIATPPPAAKAR